VGGAAGTIWSESNWDTDKIQGCVCDQGFEGSDCSLRLCPNGDDPLLTLSNNVNEKQRISIGIPSVASVNGAATVGTYAATAGGTTLTITAPATADQYFYAGDQILLGSDPKLYTVVTGCTTGTTIVVDQGVTSTATAGNIYRVWSNLGVTTTSTIAALYATPSTSLAVSALPAIATTANTKGNLIKMAYGTNNYGATNFYENTYVIQSVVVATLTYTLDQEVVFSDNVAERNTIEDPYTTYPSDDVDDAVQVTGTHYASVYHRTVANPAAGDQWFLTYYDQYGGQWNTTAQTVTTAVTTDAANLQASLRALPNRVLDDVVVSGYDGSTYTLAAGFFEDGSSKVPVANAYEFIVTFQGTTGTSGSQHLFEVEGRATAEGSFPVSKGLFYTTQTTTKANQFGTALTMVTKEGTTGKTSLDRSVAEVCSGRGLCDQGVGDCKCFSGFRGLACEFQEALV